MAKNTFKILSLCSGVGGLELGLKLALPNARTICYVEGEVYCCEILAKRMEEKLLDEAPIWSDIKTFDGTKWSGKVDCIVGGYPCQPFSIAGKKLGDKDPRHLWPHIARLIRETNAPICFFENVGGHLRLGFEQVANDLFSMGYKVKAGLFTAEEVNAPHQRERLFILAYRYSNILAYNNKLRCSDGRDNLGQGNIHKNKTGSLQKNQAGGSSRKQESKANQEPRPKITKQEFRTGTTSEDMADRSSLLQPWSIKQGSCEQQSKKETGSRNPAMADIESTRPSPSKQGIWQKHNNSSIGGELGSKPTNKKPSKSQELENSECLGHRGRNDGMDGWQGGEIEIERPFSPCNETSGETFNSAKSGIPLWPPKPEQFAEWSKIPIPLKPAILRVADGLAYRLDRVRACGNGVVPLVAAYAWRTLTNGMCIEYT